MNEFYNEPVKNRFLDSIENEQSRIVTKYVFIASKSTEEILGKDMYNFNKEEILLVLQNMNCKTIKTAQANTSFIKSYINFCISVGYRENNLNPLDGINRQFYDQFVDKNMKIHFTESELIEILEDLDNAQDQSMLYLWWTGVGGRDFSEIKNLTYYDVDWNNNILTLKDENGNERTLTVDNRCMRYLENAYKQPEYKYYVPEDDSYKEIPLMESDFIFRNTNSRRTKEAEISSSVIYSRLSSIKTKFGIEYLTQKSVSQSGQIFLMYKILKGKDDSGLEPTPTYEDWEKVGDRFNLTKINEGRHYNSRLLKEYINNDTISMYGLFANITIRETKRSK